jgi:small nuclear ribonucleoprotein E
MSGSSAPRERLMIQPISLIFRHLQQKDNIQVWLYDRNDMRINGKIAGFDEFMNLILIDACEYNVKTGQTTLLGRLLLKGDNISLISEIQ